MWHHIPIDYSPHCLICDKPFEIFSFRLVRRCRAGREPQFRTDASTECGVGETRSLIGNGGPERIYEKDSFRITTELHCAKPPNYAAELKNHPKA